MVIRAAEPAPTSWEFPDPSPGDDDLVALGADLEPGTILAAYRKGLFPMPVGRNGNGPIGWWSPQLRVVLPLADLRVTRSLRRSCRRYTVTTDAAFAQVIDTCRGLARAGGWISVGMAAAYKELHRLGWAHSVETWEGPMLVGGLYGLSIGGLFAGESMFHTARDASKVALVGLVDVLLADVGPDALLDVQWPTPHLESLGVSTIDRDDYRRRAADAVNRPVVGFTSPVLHPAGTRFHQHKASTEEVMRR